MRLTPAGPPMAKMAHPPFRNPSFLRCRSILPLRNTVAAFKKINKPTLLSKCANYEMCQKMIKK
jgi:hypothetical protein